MLKKIIGFAVIVLVLFSLYKLLSTPPKTQTKNTIDTNELSSVDMFFYYGNTCPHCKTVEEFIVQNKVDQKIKISSKEVYENKDNANELAQLVNQFCPELNQNGVGVPLAFDPKTQKCIQGDTPIIDFLKQNIQ